MAARVLRGSLLLLGISAVLVAAWAPLAGCLHAECSGGCESSFGMKAHIPVTGAALAGGSVTLCRNGACESATFGGASDAGYVGDVELSGAAFNAQAGVRGESDGGAGSVVGISLDGSRLTFANGDIYSVKVVTAQGDTLLSVSCPVTYSTEQVCGTTCEFGSVDVYPTTVSGIACGG